MVLKMTKRVKNKVKDTLDQFLFSQIESNPEYQEWVQDYKLPTYITDNISKTLRDYQEDLLDSYTNNKWNILMFPRQSGKTTTTVVEIVH